MFEVSHPQRAGLLADAPRFGLVTAFFARLRNRDEVRRTRDALSLLTDRELDDIGLCRGDIDRLLH
ncbi:hypothetical protein CCR90_12540 [Rhodovulum sulfidophilum]|nr:DUF1127 domain-containing protein [Rhodovulum sulfidophilum]ANB36111.1 hypothetical protein A6W98_07515 [Rhodovulum sulfidophilum DSM 1374]ANB39914.1 hypothetical protein A6024_07370 [Rhodovulum sulfidophilum]MBK5924590.1 hypothetical protein [Rhodovulum sulfidophilum]NDK36022.1 DUF1127 domain-containing protein [Rhodovulum sulfidophilum]OLS50321.1 hypothetical protein BV379_05645 [Rhodovulum sulfidophilum]